MSERLLLPINEAYWQVGLGRSKFYEYVASGDIEVVKVGRRTLIPQASLSAFVERLRAAQTQTAQSGIASPASRVDVGGDPGLVLGPASEIAGPGAASGATADPSPSGQS